MVDDNQIVKDPKTLTHQATSIFIKDNMKNNAPPELYDLDMEFANTKKNKNRITVISLIIFTLIFLAAAFGVTKYIEYQNSQIPISINAFEDVNLREIFDKAKQYEKEMRDAVRDLNDLYIKKEASFNELNRNADNAISIIEAENPTNKNVQIKQIKIKLEESIQRDEEFWSGEINSVKDRISTIQEKIDSYDTRILEKAKEQESIINNQQQRFDMEMEKSVKYYEEKIKGLQEDHLSQIDTISLTNKDIITTIRRKNRENVNDLEEKYNPDFTEDYTFLENSPEKEISAFEFVSNKINDIVYKEGLLNRDDVKSQITDIYQAENIFLRLKEIPYYNSPKQAIGYLEQKYHESVNKYSSFISNVSPILVDKNIKINAQLSELEQLNYFLTNYVKTNRVNGVIIDPRKKNIKLFIDPIYKVKDGTVGFVFRNDSDFIGTIEFKTNNGILVGKILDLVDKNRGLNPFDMILINLN